MAKRRRRTRKKRTGRNRRQTIPADVLPDDVLLEIFDFYMIANLSYRKSGIEAWQLLAHVCRRWRNLVFQSPRRLNLRLFFTSKTSIRDALDIWPALPLIVVFETVTRLLPGADNILATLRQSSRVCDVNLNCESWLLEKVLAAMLVPFPELTDLKLTSQTSGDETLVFPDSFLGGSAPRLRHFFLDGIPFPGLPKLLLTATHLVALKLFDIPHSGYISPEAMAALLSALSGLRILSLTLRFRQLGPASGRERQSLPFPNRSILPALDQFSFQGATEYLEDLVTRIDTPQLDSLNIVLFTEIGTPRLAQFINRTSLNAGKRARVGFHEEGATVELPAWDGDIDILIFCRDPGRLLSSVAQVCNPLSSLSTVEHLYIDYRNSRLVWMDDSIENLNTLWLQLLLPFTAVKKLTLSEEFVPSIVASLQEPVGGRIIEVLPSLQKIFVGDLEPSGPLQENIQQFVAARQGAVAISGYDSEEL